MASRTMAIVRYRHRDAGARPASRSHLGQRARAGLRERRLQPVHPVRQRARPRGRGRPAGQPRGFPRRHAAQGFRRGVVVRPRRGTQHRARRRHRREMERRRAQAADARAAAGRAVDRPLSALSRQPARDRQQREDPERRRHRAQRRSHRARRRRGVRTRQHHEHAARLVLRFARSPTCRSRACSSPTT